MTETEQLPPATEFDPLPEPKKKIKLRPKMRDAVLEVLERRRMRLPASHRSVALRHGVAASSLKSTMSRYNAGEVDLGTPETAEEMHIDKAVEMRRSLAILDRLESLLNDTLEGLVERAHKFSQKGKLLAYREMGIPWVLADMRAIAGLRNLKEQGFMAILEKAMKEKQAKSAIDISSEKIESLSDEQRAAQALRRRIEESAQAAPVIEAQ